MITVVVFLLYLVALLVIPFTAIGVGWILTKMFSFTLFQASIISLFSAGMVILFFGVTGIMLRIESLTSTVRSHLDNEEEYDDDDEDWSEVEEIKPEVSRNAPCPCNSGRKYKNCCGKNTGQKLYPTNRKSDSEDLPF